MDDHPSPAESEAWVTTRPHRTLWRQLLGYALTAGVLIAVFGFVIPQLADYQAVLDSITDIDGREWVVLITLSAWFLCAYVFVLMATLPSLRFAEGFVVQTTGTAINNTIPAGGAIALPIQYAEFLSWGFTPAAVTSALATAGVWDQLTRLSLPVLAVTAITLTGDAEWWMWAASIAGVLVVVGAVWLLVVVLGSEAAARWLGGLLDGLVNTVLGWVKRGPVDMVSFALQFRLNVASVAADRWVWITVATVLNHAAMAGLFLASIRAVGVSADQVSTAWVILAFALGRLLVMIPISPGGLGLVDLGYIGLLTLGWGAGADQELLSAGVLLFRALSFLPPIPIGLGSWLFWRHNRSWRRDWTTVKRGEVA